MIYKLKTETNVIQETKEIEVTLDNYVGSKLKALRLKNNLSQKELAKRLGMTRQNVLNLERAHHAIRLKNLEKICVLFNVRSNTILPF